MKEPWQHSKRALGLKLGTNAIGWALLWRGPPPESVRDQGEVAGPPEATAMRMALEARDRGEGVDLYVYGDEETFRTSHAYAGKDATLARLMHRQQVFALAQAMRAENVDVTILSASRDGVELVQRLVRIP